MGETNKETGSGFDEIFSFFFLESIDLNLLLTMNNSKWFYIIIFRKFSHNSSHFYSEHKRHDRLLPPSWKIARTKSASSSPGLEMHKFYWRNTHGPGARRGETSDNGYHHYRLGKSGSADNILSEVSLRQSSRTIWETRHISWGGLGPLCCLLLGWFMSEVGPSSFI